MRCVVALSAHKGERQGQALDETIERERERNSLCKDNLNHLVREEKSLNNPCLLREFVYHISS